MARRRISIRKIIQTLVTMVAVAGCAVAMISADRQQAHLKVKGVQLLVKSPAGVHFLTEDALRAMLFTGRHINPYTLSVSQVDERSMEAILRANPWVRDAQVYIDAERVMHIILTQRVPVVRIFEENSNSYYLDAALQSMPLSAQYTHYTPVITGVPRLGSDSASQNVRACIVGLVQRIQHDTFWSAQVSQIDMRRDGGFELIPVLGKQRIIIGDTSQLTEKLNNLFAFYKQVQNKVGWDKYNTIDVRYEGQVVAAPALTWKAPVDRAVSNMNWLQAIMDNAPAQVQLGGDATAFADSINVAEPKQSNSQSSSQVAKPTPAKKPTQSVGPNAKSSRPQQPDHNTSSHKQNPSQHGAPKR